MSGAPIQTMLSGLGIPSVRFAWPEGAAPSLPWAVFWLEEEDGIYADNRMDSRRRDWTLELYQKTSDEELEARLEDAIIAAFGPFRKGEAWVDDENVIQTTYYFTEIGE